LDQPGQRYAHHVVEIGVGEAPVQLQAREDALKEDAALSTGTRSAAAQTDRSCESVKASMAVWRCRRYQTVSNFQREPACQCIRFAACGARPCALIRPAAGERLGTQQNASTSLPIDQQG
jgi:hypothetical protein